MKPSQTAVEDNAVEDNVVHIPEHIPDVQASADTRQIAINKVGIRGLRHPMAVMDRSRTVQNTVAMFGMYVNLAHDVKGTHMSRFVDVLNNHAPVVSVDSFAELLSHMAERLEADSGIIEMSFPYFVNKTAPVSRVQSLMDYEVKFEIEAEKVPAFRDENIAPNQPASNFTVNPNRRTHPIGFVRAQRI